MKVIKLSQRSVNRAISVLKRGGVIIFPTDTVYGFLADGSNKNAVGDIFKIKKRPSSKPLSVFVKDMKMADELVIINEKTAKTLKKFWPGKYTFVLRKKKGAVIYGTKKDSVAVRIPQYKFLNDLLKKINRPLSQTSVNISGKKPLNNINDIIKEFSNDKRIGLIISGGNLLKSKPSKVIDLSKDKIKVLR